MSENKHTKRIPLTQGQFAIVDDADFEWLSKYKWFADWHKQTKTYYAARNSKTKDGKYHYTSMAREILGLKRGDKREADHIGHVTLDNRRLNLRVVTQQQNRCNQKNPQGYYWNKDRKQYIAQIQFNGKKIYLGLFRTPKEARAAYLKAKQKYHKFER